MTAPAIEAPPVAITTVRCCPEEAHDRLKADRHLMVQLTSPGARFRAPAGPIGTWLELRHCTACDATFTLLGEGDSKRWLYTVTNAAHEPVFMANTIDEVVAYCRQNHVGVEHVGRSMIGAHTERLTIGEVAWLAREIGAQR